MQTHEEMVEFQAEQHKLLSTDEFESKEAYIVYLMHACAYVQASRLAAGKRVLDLGCNIGYGSEILNQSASQVVGVDVSEKAIEAARYRYRELGIDFQHIDGEKLPFDDNCFDLIVSFEVIEHIVNYDKYLGELKRVLSPTGVALLSTPNSLLRLYPGMKPWNRFHVREFDSVELASLLKGFFAEVNVLGLFAHEEIYSIERDRLHRIREGVRKRQLRRSGLLATAKRLVPSFLRAQLRRLRNNPLDQSEPQVPVNDMDSEFAKRHDVNSCFYQMNDVADCLDLLAVCTRDRDILEETIQLLANDAQK